jgi:cytochrome c-type biogenesis protein CcmE
MKAKHQRLWLVALAAIAVLAAVLLGMWALKDQASYFYTPGDARRDGVEPGRVVRLGGMVEKGSLKKQPDGVSIRFVVTDGLATVPVRFTGIVPDLFREGSGVVAEGRFAADASFTADAILAKHDERYMPPQVAGAMHKSDSLEPERR